MRSLVWVSGLTLDKHNEYARELLTRLKGDIGAELVDALLNADQTDEAGIYEQRDRVEALKKKLSGIKKSEAKQLAQSGRYSCQKKCLDHGW